VAHRGVTRRTSWCLEAVETRAQLDRAFWADLEKVGVARGDEGGECAADGAGEWAEWYPAVSGDPGGMVACAESASTSRLYHTDLDDRVLTRVRRQGQTPAELTSAWAKGELDICSEPGC
jgi:hypothetical protein